MSIQWFFNTILAFVSLFSFGFYYYRRRRDKMKVTLGKTVSVPIAQIAIGDDEGKYREVYFRILEYFDREKPFLDPELTEADVARVLFSNRSYIRNALNAYAKTSFPNFVSQQRIIYATALFTANPSLRISELYVLSGFKSYSAFNLAFKLHVNMTPSEWCKARRENLLE